MKYGARLDYWSNQCRSREGAWIEIPRQRFIKIRRSVAPARERGLKCGRLEAKEKVKLVAPARERGLKSSKNASNVFLNGRSREGAWIEIFRL